MSKTNLKRHRIQELQASIAFRKRILSRVDDELVVITGQVSELEEEEAKHFRASLAREIDCDKAELAYLKTR